MCFRVISVRSGAVSGVRVSVQKCPDPDAAPAQTNGAAAADSIQDDKWRLLGGAFREVHLDKMGGKNFANKLELLMASLAKAVPTPAVTPAGPAASLPTAPQS